MKIFTGDLHLGHKNIVKFTNRGIDCLSQDQHEISKFMQHEQIYIADQHREDLS